MRTRFFIEAGSAGAFALFVAITSVWPDWVELVFGVDPDRGDGQLEWAIVIVFGVLAALCATLARLEWQRARRATDETTHD